MRTVVECGRVFRRSVDYGITYGRRDQVASIGYTYSAHRDRRDKGKSTSKFIIGTRVGPYLVIPPTLPCHHLYSPICMWTVPKLAKKQCGYEISWKISISGSLLLHCLLNNAAITVAHSERRLSRTKHFTILQHFIGNVKALYSVRVPISQVKNSLID